MSNRDSVVKIIRESIAVKEEILADSNLLQMIEQLSEICLDSLRNNGKIIFAGNGGSFADSQHLAAEFVSRLQFDRDPLASVALGTNSSSLTAIGNDYGYEQVFARELRAIANTGDVFIPISTSGNSPNILASLTVVKEKDLRVIGLTGKVGGKMASICNCIKVPSERTERIQEAHIMIGHIVCGLVETSFFKEKS